MLHESAFTGINPCLSIKSLTVLISENVKSKSESMVTRD